MNNMIGRPMNHLNQRPSFTLVELLLSMAIVAMLASTALFAIYGVMESAKESRTKTQITKLHELIMTKWESYRTRAVRFSPTTISSFGLPANPTAIDYGRLRLAAMRELLRCELPDRVTDVGDSPTIVPSPAVWKGYQSSARAAVGINWYQPSQPDTGPFTGMWSYTHEGAECLYLIVASIREGNTSGLDFFMESEIGDVDGDGMKEILDGWGRPIEWLRWAPGFATMPGVDGGWGVAGADDDNDSPQTIDELDERGYPGTDDVSELQIRDATTAPDTFDPLHVDPRWVNPQAPASKPYALYPLIFSAGKDGEYAIKVDFDTDPSTPNQVELFRNANTSPKNDPYYITPTTPPYMFGQPVGTEADDNVTNHLISTN